MFLTGMKRLFGATYTPAKKKERKGSLKKDGEEKFFLMIASVAADGKQVYVGRDTRRCSSGESSVEK